MVAYNYYLIVKPMRELLGVMGALKLVTTCSAVYRHSTNGQLHDKLVKIKEDYEYLQSK